LEFEPENEEAKKELSKTDLLFKKYKEKETKMF